MILWDVMPCDFPDKPAASAFRVEEQSHLEMGTMYGSRGTVAESVSQWEILATSELTEQPL
jgi:hypothetical protein